MFRRIAWGLGLSALLALSVGCHTTTLSPTIPTAPVTGTFSGLLHPTNVNTFSFVTSIGGAVTATLTSVGPDATQTVGFSLGTFNTSTNVCTVGFDNNAALQGAVFNTTASTAGAYCVRIYDNGSVATAVAAGTATAFTYTITVSYPGSGT
jgi:hypothetical protein